jgi:hypothetical protein
MIRSNRKQLEIDFNFWAKMKALHVEFLDCTAHSSSAALLGLRTMRCVLLHGQAAAQAGIAKKVDQHPRPQPEDVAHACEEAAHRLPYHTIYIGAFHSNDIHSSSPPTMLRCILSTLPML